MTEVNFDFKPDQTFHTGMNGTPPHPLQLNDVFKHFVQTQRRFIPKSGNSSAVYCEHFKIIYDSINKDVINGNGKGKATDSFNNLKEALENIDDYKIEMKTDTTLNPDATIRPSRGTQSVNANPNHDLACFTYDELSKNFNINEIHKYKITLRPDFKQNAVRKPRANVDQMKANLRNIMVAMGRTVMNDAGPSQENVLGLSIKDYYLFIWSLFIGDPLHDYKDGYRNKKGGIKGISFGVRDPIASKVIEFLGTQHDKLIDEYKKVTLVLEGDEFIKKVSSWMKTPANIENNMLTLMADGGGMGADTQRRQGGPALKKQRVEQLTDIEYMLSLYKNTYNELKRLKVEDRRFHDNIRFITVNAPGYPTYDKPNDWNFRNAYNDSCKILPASIIDGAACGDCGTSEKGVNYPEGEEHKKFEFGNTNIKIQMYNSDNTALTNNYVSFVSTITEDDNENVIYNLTITRSIAPLAGDVIYTHAKYKYIIFEKDMNPDKVTSVTVDTELGTYIDDGAIDKDSGVSLMEVNNMVPFHDDANEHTFGFYLKEFMKNSTSPDIIQTARKAMCDFMFALNGLFKNGGYNGQIFSSTDVIVPTSTVASSNYPVLTACADRPAAVMAYLLTSKWEKGREEKGSNPNLRDRLRNEMFHVLFAVTTKGGPVIKMANLGGVIVEANQRQLNDYISTRTGGGINSLDWKRSFGNPYRGTKDFSKDMTFGRAERFNTLNIPLKDYIFTFFVGCSKFIYPVIVLIWYNEIKNDRDMLRRFLNATVRKKGLVSYEPISKNNEEWKIEISRIIYRPMYDKIYNIANSIEEITVSPPPPPPPDPAAAAPAEDGTGSSSTGDLVNPVSVVLEAKAPVAVIEVLDAVASKLSNPGNPSETQLDKDSSSPPSGPSPYPSPYKTPPPGLASAVDSTTPTPIRARIDTKDNRQPGGSTRTRRRRKLHRNHRRTQYTNKHKRSSSKTTKRATIKRSKSYRKHNRTIKRRKSRRHQ
jgi:hypothetical protein